MGESIGELLPSAMVRLASPIPIAMVIVLMSFPRGRLKAWVFIAGWLLGGAALMLPVLLLAEGSPLAREDSIAGAWVRVGFGALFLLLGGWTAWRLRRRTDAQTAPRWMERIERASAGWVLGVGVGFGVFGGPKNIAALLHAALVISRAGYGWVVDLALVAAFDVFSTLGVVLPLAVGTLWPDRTDHVLQVSKRWLLRHSNAILLVIFVTFGTLLLVRGLLRIAG